MNRKSGISLIALIITILVIIILTIVLISSMTKTPETASRAKFTSDIAEVQQAVSTKISENNIQYITNPDSVDLNKGFTRIEVIGSPDTFESFPLEEGEEGTVQGYMVNLDTIKMERLTIGQGYNDATQVVFGDTDALVYDATGEVFYAKGQKVGDIIYYAKEDSTTEENMGVNPPVLGAGMRGVYWDENYFEITQGEAKYNAKDWYDYVAQTGATTNGGTSRWANAKTADGSYFVWIPRYAYKITYYTDATKTTVSGTKTAYGNIDVLFMSGTSNTKYIDREGNTIKDLPAGYTVHPAFTNNISLGGWDREITGLWIGKYEGSRIDATATVEGTSTNIKVVPGVKNWSTTTKIVSVYLSSKAYNTVLNSHMLKSSEWGAAAYLTHSKYGRNSTEVTKNNNSNYLTGYAGPTVNAAASTTNTYAYNTSQGVLASTTGNIYGIYDMSGGDYEYVASYFSGSTPASGLTTPGGELVYVEGTTTIDTIGKKYATPYSGINVSTNYKIGDATYETGSWNGDSAYFFASSGGAFLYRGGYCGDNNIAGIFSYGRSCGNCVMGFRVCLIP